MQVPGGHSTQSWVGVCHPGYSSHTHKTRFWYLLGVLFKISGNHPRHFYMGVLPPTPGIKPWSCLWQKRHTFLPCLWHKFKKKRNCRSLFEHLIPDSNLLSTLISAGLQKMLKKIFPCNWRVPMYPVYDSTQHWVKNPHPVYESRGWKPITYWAAAHPHIHVGYIYMGVPPNPLVQVFLGVVTSTVRRNEDSWDRLF